MLIRSWSRTVMGPRRRQAMDLDPIKTELDEYGFVVLEKLIPADQADAMAERLVEIARQRPNAERLEQTVKGLLIADDIFMPLVTNPTFLELARYKLGDG